MNGEFMCVRVNSYLQCRQCGPGLRGRVNVRRSSISLVELLGLFSDSGLVSREHLWCTDTLWLASSCPLCPTCILPPTVTTKQTQTAVAGQKACLERGGASLQSLRQNLMCVQLTQVRVDGSCERERVETEVSGVKPKKKQQKPCTETVHPNVLSFCCHLADNNAQQNMENMYICVSRATITNGRKRRRSPPQPVT